MEFEQVPSPRASAEVPVDLQVLRLVSPARRRRAPRSRAPTSSAPSTATRAATAPSAWTRTTSPRSTSGTGARFALHARRFLRDQRDVDEVVQEAFLRLFLALPELETELQAHRLLPAHAHQPVHRPVPCRPAPAAAAEPGLRPADALRRRRADRPGGAGRGRRHRARRAVAAAAAAPRRRWSSARWRRSRCRSSRPSSSVPRRRASSTCCYRARRALRRLLAGSTADPAALIRLAAGTSGKLGVLIAIVLAGLGSGPDLRVVPVVGKDLPDLPSVAEVVVKQLPAPPKPRAAAPAPSRPPPSPSSSRSPRRTASSRRWTPRRRRSRPA